MLNNIHQDTTLRTTTQSSEKEHYNLSPPQLNQSPQTSTAQLNKSPQTSHHELNNQPQKMSIATNLIAIVTNRNNETLKHQLSGILENECKS